MQSEKRRQLAAVAQAVPNGVEQKTQLPDVIKYLLVSGRCLWVFVLVPQGDGANMVVPLGHAQFFTHGVPLF